MADIPNKNIKNEALKMWATQGGRKLTIYEHPLCSYCYAQRLYLPIISQPKSKNIRNNGNKH